MIRVAVVDDNEKDCERLIQYLRRYEKEDSTGMEIRVFHDGEDLLADYKPRYDLILLDIEMPGMNGMLDLGADTFWEEYDPEKKPEEQYEMYGDPFGKSMCHAWAASPVWLLARGEKI